MRTCRSEDRAATLHSDAEYVSAEMCSHWLGLLLPPSNRNRNFNRELAAHTSPNDENLRDEFSQRQMVRVTVGLRGPETRRCLVSVIARLALFFAQGRSYLALSVALRSIYHSCRTVLTAPEIMRSRADAYPDTFACR
jgi:hypothetical protein